MKIKFLPNTEIGKWADILCTAFIVLITLKIIASIPLPTFFIAALGLAGFILTVVAVIRKDTAILNFISIFTGLIIILWIAAEIAYPH